MGEMVTEPAGVIRVSHSDREGTGLEPWEEMDPDSLVSGAPVQRGWLADETEATGYLAGVWDCTAFVDKPGPYSVDEFMLLLEGRVVMELPDGREIPIEAGEAFVIPKGLQCQWKMPDYVRKVFMIVDDPVPEGPENASLGRITLPDLSASGPDTGPVETSRLWFANATGRMRVSVREMEAGTTAERPAESNELIHVLAGALTLTGGAASARVETGETIYVKAGTVLARETGAGTRLLVSSYAPA